MKVNSWCEFATGIWGCTSSNGHSAMSASSQEAESKFHGWTDCFLVHILVPRQELCSTWVMSAILCTWIGHWSWLLCCLAAIMCQSILGPLNCNVLKTNKSLHYPVNCRPSPGNIKGGGTVFGSGLLESTLLLLLTQRSNQTAQANHVWLWCSRLERPLKSATPEPTTHIWHICEDNLQFQNHNYN